jgi:Fe2+ transport system protein FeoA
MCSMRVVSASSARLRPLSSLAPGTSGIVFRVQPPPSSHPNGHHTGTLKGSPTTAAEDRVDRLVALGVTPGATITVLQTFPGIVFLCDQTELAVERAVADSIVVNIAEG